MSTLSIFLSLGLLMFLAYRGFSVLLLAPLMAALAVLLSGDAALLLPIYTDTFMGALSRYLMQFFPLFLLGAVFGQLMADSGAAHRIALWAERRVGSRHAVLTVVLACGLLTYGGVSLFVVAFAIFPISQALFRDADIPRRLIPASIALGSFTFTMTALPGTPAIQNAIPIAFFGTNSFAAPGLGVIAALIMGGGGLLWLQSRVARARRLGEGYGEDSRAGAAIAPGSEPDISTLQAFIPLVLVIGVNALMTYAVFPALDMGFMKARFASLDPGKSAGIWSILIALGVAIAWLLLVQARQLKDMRSSINAGCSGALLPIFNTASEVGYGAVIASLAGFALIRDVVLNVSPGNPLISEAVAMNVLAGITGSSSGGLSIALQALGSDYLRMAQEAGISPELMHRVAVLAAGGMDTLPHSGAVITLLTICGLTHRQSYGNIAMVTVALPMLALGVVIALGTAFGSF
ncbi:GntP family permease [Amphibiibacter pelophylacis]|uniref:GntP family permease n=1 Tax=Amphibiibacter pelophylacis TaxID=1799477 RepID=A0ACC6P010_9BURK